MDTTRLLAQLKQETRENPEKVYRTSPIMVRGWIRHQAKVAGVKLSEDTVIRWYAALDGVAYDALMNKVHQERQQRFKILMGSHGDTLELPIIQLPEQDDNYGTTSIHSITY